jgi:fatty acid desaturase
MIGVMAVAARVSPKDFFTPDEWEPLARRSSWKGLALAWAVIFAAAAVAVTWPLTLPVAIAVIGARQLGLAILMHDAAHGALHPNRAVNDWVGNHLTTGQLAAYRPYHLAHHKYAQQAEDPDLGLSAPFPITRASLRRKILRDLTGQTYYKQQWEPLVRQLRARRRGEPLRPILRAALVRKRRFLAGMVLTLAATAPFGLWWVWPALWLAPQATWLPMVTRLRNIAEHACVAQGEPDPLRHARSTRANWLERAFLAPYWVNHHCEHHMFMHVPCHRLPRLARRLAEKGVRERMLTAPGYWQVLAMASAKRAQRPAH